VGRRDTGAVRKCRSCVVKPFVGFAFFCIASIIFLFCFVLFYFFHFLFAEITVSRNTNFEIYGLFYEHWKLVLLSCRKTKIAQEYLFYV
jgi:hypothetical protein